MPKISPSKAIENRLDELERQMKQKDQEILDLKSSLRSAEQNFEKELNERDLIITDLFAKIDELKSPDQPDSIVVDVGTADVLATEPDEIESPPASKVEHDLLILGDSLVRNLNPASINPGGDTTIECVPGARPDGLVEKFEEMIKSNSYKRVIVHGGTNLVPKFSPASVAERIIESLEKIRALSPESKVAFSSLLPKEGDHLLRGINEVNYRVEKAGLCGHHRTRFGFAPHAKYFVNSSGRVDSRLFQRDGIHLTEMGTRAFEKGLNCLAIL